jgi:hypothetical protein
MQKGLGGLIILIILGNLLIAGAVVFGVVKGCNYITSGKAASDFSQVKGK